MFNNFVITAPCFKYFELKNCPENILPDYKVVKFRSHYFYNKNYVLLILEDNSIYNLKINGHTDSSGDDAKNLKLSKQRAKAVEAYLVKKGIDDKRLASDGFGETISVADNKTSNGRALNRRVELKVEFTKLIK